MKFAYIDESGNDERNDVFVMCGLIVDAYSLRKTTAEFDNILGSFFAQYSDIELGRTESGGFELKTNDAINGNRKWRKVDAQIRKDFVRQLCQEFISARGKIAGIGISIKCAKDADDSVYKQPFGTDYWVACGMYVSSLIQREMQKEKGNKGHTVLIVDDNKVKMPKISQELHESESWYDGLYQTQRVFRGKREWKKRTKNDRFDQIINTAFAIDSEHSSLIQVADAVCHIIRRHLEIEDGVKEKWNGERNYYDSIFKILTHKNVLLRINTQPDALCNKYYKYITHQAWP